MYLEISKTKKVNKKTNNHLDEIWSKLRKSNSDALSKLFCVSYSWLFKYGYKIVPQEAFIKDSIQELFLNLWKRREAISAAKSVKSYLLSSLRRIIFRRLKKQRNRTERNHSYKKNLFSDSYNVEELMIYFEEIEVRRRKLRHAIASLSKRQREAIYLKFYNGLSNTEIAQVMNINKQSVYNHVSKAIGRIQEFVQ